MALRKNIARAQKNQREHEIELRELAIRKQERLTRIKEIQEEDEANTATSWYLLIFSTFTLIMDGIQELFRKVARDNPLFPIFFPDNPGTRDLLSAIGYSTWSSLLKLASPFALAMNWANTLVAIKRLWYKEKRSAWDYASVILSFVGSAAWTTLFALGIAGLAMSAVTAIISVPYLIPAIFGVYALYGLVMCAKNCYHAYKAWKAGDMEECKAHLKNAGKQLIGMVTNTLAAVVSYFLTVEMMNGVKQLFSFETLGDGIQAITATFDKIAILLYPLAASVAVSAVINTSKMNHETCAVIWNVAKELSSHPLEAIKTACHKAYYALKAKPLECVAKVLQETVKLPLRIGSLLLIGPIHGLVKLVSMGIDKWKSLFSPVQPISAPISRSHSKSSTAKLLHRKTKEVLQTVQEKIKTLEEQFPPQYAPQTKQAERAHLEKLEKFIQGKTGYRYEKVDDIERESKALYGKGMFYRNYFWTKPSVLQQLTDQVREIEPDIRRAAAAAAA